ncbi:glycoside hydrolase family 172 protein [Planctomycetota bacterium]
MNMGLGNIMKLSDARTRMVTAENVYSEKGRGGMAEVTGTQPEVEKIGQETRDGSAARDLGLKWKVRPCILIPGQKSATIMDTDGPGIIQHIWITVNNKFHRDLILRIYWDDNEYPSVESPLGDFFCTSWRADTNILALPINVNPRNGLNSYFPMPFKKHARVEIENRSPEDCSGFFYAITYAETEVADEDAYFHASFRRTNPVPYKEDYLIVDGIEGKGQFVGTYMAWQQNNNGWWGEGEIKFFMDGDEEFPTLCGTGTEDYFGGAWGFGQNFTAPFLGYQEGACDGKPGNRHGLYRFHIMDPIRFDKNLKVTMQAIGWRSEHRYLPLQDDIASVAYWYQTMPGKQFPALPDRDYLEII